VSIDATLARGFIIIHNTGGIFRCGVVWKPHCQVIFCHDAFDFSSTYKFCCFVLETETAFAVRVQQFISELWLEICNVLLENCSATRQLWNRGNRDIAARWRNAMKTNITDVSRKSSLLCWSRIVSSV